MNILALHNKIEEVCPIDGVSFQTGIVFKHSATPNQKAAAQTIFDAYDERTDALYSARDKANQLRAREEDDCFEYLGKNIQCDSRSRERINGAAAYAKLDSTFETDWVCKDDSVIHLSNSQIIGLEFGLIQYGQIVFEKYRAIKNSFETMTAEELLDWLQNN